MVMGMRGKRPDLERWQLDLAGVRSRMYLAPTPRERERWHALWLLCRNMTASATAHALGRDAHTIGRWATAFSEGGPAALIFEQSGGSPPPSKRAQQAALSAAVQELPAKSGIVMANWNWKVVRLFASERFSISLSRSSCLNYLHRLGFAFKRPKKRLLKADAEKREAFVEEYAALAFQSQESGEKIFFADEAHFRADAELRGKWVLRGEPVLVDSTSPRYGEKASYYSAVCLETGQVEVDGTGGEQQLRNVGSLPGAVEGEAQRSAERDLGQRAGPPGIRGAGMAGQARSEPAAGEPAGIQPGLQR